MKKKKDFVIKEKSVATTLILLNQNRAKLNKNLNLSENFTVFQKRWQIPYL